MLQDATFVFLRFFSQKSTDKGAGGCGGPSCGGLLGFPAAPTEMGPSGSIDGPLMAAGAAVVALIVAFHVLHPLYVWVSEVRRHAKE